MCVPVFTGPNLSALRSAARGDLVVPRTRLQLGNRAFCVAGPVAWNSLPLDICSASTLSTFKTCSRHIFFHVPTLLTNCFAEYEQQTFYGALVVTLAMLLRLINCRFIIIIIIIVIVVVIIVIGLSRCQILTSRELGLWQCGTDNKGVGCSPKEPVNGAFTRPRLKVADLSSCLLLRVLFKDPALAQWLTS